LVLRHEDCVEEGLRGHLVEDLRAKMLEIAGHDHVSLGDDRRAVAAVVRIEQRALPSGGPGVRLRSVGLRIDQTVTISTDPAAEPARAPTKKAASPKKGKAIALSHVVYGPVLGEEGPPGAPPPAAFGWGPDEVGNRFQSSLDLSGQIVREHLVAAGVDRLLHLPNDVDLRPSILTV
jgi:hypothetical protein